MDATSRASLWAQFGAAIDMLENGIHACPDHLWGDRTRQPEFWHLVYHTLFYLDLYLSDARAGFTPPAPFTLAELDPAGVLPARVYSKEELLEYLKHGREKARSRIAEMTLEDAGRRCDYKWIELSVLESLLYNMRHVQHHVAQLNLLLRQAGERPPAWIASAENSLDR
jgi:uncharacterized damage-inducible protein DinB